MDCNSVQDAMCGRSSLAPCLKSQWCKNHDSGIHTNFTGSYRGWTRRKFHNHRWQCLQSWVIARRTTTGLRPNATALAVPRVDWCRMTETGRNRGSVNLGLFALCVQVLCLFWWCFWSTCLGNQVRVQVRVSSDWLCAIHLPVHII